MISETAKKKTVITLTLIAPSIKSLGIQNLNVELHLLGGRQRGAAPAQIRRAETRNPGRGAVCEDTPKKAKLLTYC